MNKYLKLKMFALGIVGFCAGYFIQPLFGLSPKAAVIIACVVMFLAAMYALNTVIELNRQQKKLQEIIDEINELRP